MDRRSGKTSWEIEINKSKYSDVTKLRQYLDIEF